MIFNLVMTVIDRENAETVISICSELGLPVTFSMLGYGTAKDEHLKLYGLEAKQKAAVLAFADDDKTQQLMKAARRKLFIDIPGNGIMLSIPLKSVGGGRTLAYLTGEQAPGGTAPSLDVAHELILVILNQSYSDDVMRAARGAGAGGGTVLHAKGTGADYARKFLGVNLASEKEIIMIVAETSDKTQIMKAIAEQTGPQTPAGAICISLPVTDVAGLRAKV